MRKANQSQKTIETSLSHTQLSEDQVSDLNEYLNLIDLWNKRINLTAVRDPILMIERHFADSLAPDFINWGEKYQLTALHPFSVQNDDLVFG